MTVMSMMMMLLLYVALSMEITLAVAVLVALMIPSWCSRRQVMNCIAGASAASDDFECGGDTMGAVDVEQEPSLYSHMSLMRWQRVQQQQQQQ